MCCILMVLLVTVTTLCARGTCTLTDICTNSNLVTADLANATSSLVFEARLLADTNTCKFSSLSSMRWRVTTVHKGKSIIKKDTVINLQKRLNETEQLLCSQFCSNISYLIFADYAAYNSINATQTATLKWMVIPTRRISAEVQNILCKECGKLLVKIKRRKVEVKEGEAIRFTCEVTSRRSVSIQWTKNEHPLNRTNQVQISGKRRGSQLTIRAAAVRDAGVYRCRATSSGGGESASAETRVVVAAKVCTQQSSTCDNQDHCLERGVCCLQLGRKYCVCNDGFSGDRCDERVVTDEVIGRKEHATFRGDDTEVVVIIVIIAAMLTGVLLIVIGVTAVKLHRQRLRLSRNADRHLNSRRHCHRGNQSISAASPIPFMITNSDFQISPTTEVTNDGVAFPVQAVVEEDCNKCREKIALPEDDGVGNFDDFNEIIERRSNGTMSTRSLNSLKWESSDAGIDDDDDDDLKGNRASDADVLDVDDDRCVTSTSRGGGETSAMSSQYGGDTTSWTHDDDDDDSDNDVDATGDGLLRRLYAYTLGVDQSLDRFAAGGVLPSLHDYIGTNDGDSDGSRDIELVPTASSIVD